MKGHPPASQSETATAFSALYDSHHLKIYRFVYLLLGGPQPVAEDLTAQTFERAWKAWPTFAGTPEQARAWLFTIARNQVTDWFRGHKPEFLLTELEAETLYSGESSPEVLAIQRNDWHMLVDLLAALPADDREVLLLRYWMGWRVKEIAGHLNQTENGISVRIGRILARLRKAWPAEGEP